MSLSALSEFCISVQIFVVSKIRTTQPRGALFGLLLLIPLIQDCGGRSHDNPEAVENVPARQLSGENLAVPVTAVIAKTDTLPRYVSTSATVRPLKAARIMSQVPGRIMQLRVLDGTRVERNQVLLQLETDAYQDVLAETRSSFFHALGTAVQECRANNTDNYSFLETWFLNSLNLNRLPPFPASVISNHHTALEPSNDDVPSNYSWDNTDTIPATLNPAEYMILARQKIPTLYAAMRRAERELAACTIRAPFTGVVSGLEVAELTWITANSELFSITALDSVQLDIEILVDELNMLQTGTPFQILSPKNGQVIKADRILGVSPQIDEKRHTGQAFARLSNPGRRWKSGQILPVRVQKAFFPDFLLIPVEAVLIRNDRELVFTVEQGIAKWCYVVLGPRNEQYVAIDSGISPGDTVIVTGHYSLAHDSPVEVELVSSDELRQ